MGHRAKKVGNCTHPAEASPETGLSHQICARAAARTIIATLETGHVVQNELTSSGILVSFSQLAARIQRRVQLAPGKGGPGAELQ